MTDLVKLNEHLFSQLDRLDNPDLSGDKLSDEINRARAVDGIAKQVISNAEVQLEAIKLRTEFTTLKTDSSMKMLIGGGKSNAR